MIRLLEQAALATLCATACGVQDSPSAPPDSVPKAAKIEIAPAVDTITAVGGTLALTAEVLNVLSNPISDAAVTWSSTDSALLAVSDGGEATALGSGFGAIVASAGLAADTAWIWIAPVQTHTTGLQTPPDLMVTAGPLVSGADAQVLTRSFDAKFAAAELATYSAHVAGGRSGADASSHYGALRSRYQWSVRHGLPVGPGAPVESPYVHGVEMTRAYLTNYSKPNDFRAAPHNNTAMPDVEMLYRLEGDADALAHLTTIARYYGALYAEHFFDLTGANSDPRSSAVLLQTLSAAHRLDLPYTGRESWGSSWKEAAAHVVSRLAARIDSGGKVVSQAHQNSGQGDEAYFMNAMLASELLHWHGFVEAQPAWLDLARRIMDHLVTEYEARGVACLPYLSKSRGCAPDLAGFYVWPALVLWQETGDEKYRIFALANLRAAQNAFIEQVKAFNQVYSTGAQSTDALLAGVAWH